MKYNLKNRPRPYNKGSMPYLPLGTEWERYLVHLDRWFEGFEKELREIAENNRTRRKDGSVSVQSRANLPEFIEKEILGE